MKQKMTIFVGVMLVLIMASCGGGGAGSQLDGIWTGDFWGDSVTVAHGNGMCFIVIGEGRWSDAEMVQVTYSNGSGTANFEGERFPFTRNGDTITTNVMGDNLTLNRDKSRSATPSALSGIWTVNYDGDIINMVFINNMVFIYEEYRGETYVEDYGTFTFSSNSGSIRSVWGDVYNISLSGNNLTLNWDGEVLNFTKAR